MNKLTERLQVKTCAQCPNHCESGDGKKDCEASDYPWLAVRVEFMSLISCLSFSSFCWNNHQTVGFNFATFFTVAGSVCFKPTCAQDETSAPIWFMVSLHFWLQHQTRIFRHNLRQDRTTDIISTMRYVMIFHRRYWMCAIYSAHPQDSRFFPRSAKCCSCIKLSRCPNPFLV